MAYKNQHTIPKAYLKYFTIDNFVHFLELKNPYTHKIRKEGIGHKVFCKTNYYNFNGNKFVEKEFSKIESKDYEIIMDRLSTKQNIGYDTKQRIIKWVMMLKIRNTTFRDSLARLTTWIELTHYGIKYGRKAMDEKETEFILDGKKKVKQHSYQVFLTENEILKL
ncbi:DUF4238 domain-containing protein [uncultured Roseivirga sp.]|uniref:DUF4238 domain-containing protein n=1 Tax=uncultured Roseivirga sp. TaxID=543088 RepID=UPI0030DCE98D|tara:strand:+ start:442 stop:936 length:495 start_codon:yes stop_codon:yes gene_type:complete